MLPEVDGNKETLALLIGVLSVGIVGSLPESDISWRIESTCIHCCHSIPAAEDLGWQSSLEPLTLLRILLVW